MPTIEVLFDDLQRLLGMKLPQEVNELDDILSFVKGEVESLEGQELSIEIKDGNRPDLWSVEGIARELRGALGIEEGLKDYSVEGYSSVEVSVDPRLLSIRPYIACAVVKNVHLDDEVIREFMHLQDKLDQTYGRKRRRASIGLYNFNLITPPLYYGVAKPTEVSFIPLGNDKEMNLKEMIEVHPKGLEYGQIVKVHEHWPILLDAERRILSFPPIINSNDLGRITESVRDIFIEVTGTSYQTVLNTLMMVTLSVSDRGEKIFSTKINYPYGEKRVDVTPKLEKKRIDLETKYVDYVLGLDLKGEAVLKLLKKARYDVNQINSDIINVTVPCYRIDVMHQVDIVEDIAIMLGYNKIKPQWPRLITFGRISSAEFLSDLAREVMIGLGFQEVLTFSLTDKQTLFSRMNLRPSRIVEISNPMLSKYTCLRNALIPGLMEFLSNNTHAGYPQKIFEVGECVTFDRKNEKKVMESKKLACLITHANSNFSEVKAVLDSFFLNMGLTYELKETIHKSFIDGRVGVVLVDEEDIGIIGEVNPRVLENWKLENPVVGFEISLAKILRRKSMLEGKPQ